MSNPFFRFQQFCVWHDKCGMKVGTDGVLLGAWADVAECQNILDIGTGSGLVALMAAQRAPQAQITGIDVEANAVTQAHENVANSPFAGRIKIEFTDVRNFEGKFDCIVCNPPFFSQDTLPPSAERSLARNASNLSFEELCQSVNRLLTDSGVFNVILPIAEYKSFVTSALLNQLQAYRKCFVKTTERKEAKRIMLSFRRISMAECTEKAIVLQDEFGKRTEQYKELTKDFYLVNP